MAQFINLMTGRGTLGQFDAAIPFLTLGMFSPRWVASRVQLAGLIPKLAFNEVAGRVFRSRGANERMNPQLRKLMWRDLGSYAGAMGVTLGLLAAAGAYGLAHIEVGWNPEDSDFGKVVVNGRHHYDLTSGLQQYIVFAVRMAESFAKRERGEKMRDSEQPAAILEKFARGKASPVGGFAADIFTGRDYSGRPITASRAALDLIEPLILKDFLDGYNVEGSKFGGLGMVPSLAGIGYSAYEKGGQASGVPEFAKEAQRRDVFFGEKFLRGESKEMEKARLARRKGYVEQYGPALIRSQHYVSADDELKEKMLRHFAEETNRLANERKPNPVNLAPPAIARAIRQSERRNGTRQKHEEKRLIYSPVSP